MLKEVSETQSFNLFREKTQKSVYSKVKLNLMAWLLLLPSLVSFVFFVWQPLISGLILSFFKTKGYSAERFIGLQNYKDVISDSAFISALTNSALYTFWSLVIGFLVPIVTAVILNELIHWNAFFKFSIYFPSMVPGIAASLLWYFMFDPGKGGLLNTILINLGLPTSQWLQNSQMTIPLIIVTLTWRAFGGTTLIYLASLQGINQELYEATTIDGASLFQRFKNITLPQISNIIVLMLIMQIIGVFQIMAEPLTMTEGGPNNASLSLMLQSYFYAFRYFEAGKSMALGAITFVILSVMTVIYQLYIKYVGNEQE